MCDIKKDFLVEATNDKYVLAERNSHIDINVATVLSDERIAELKNRIDRSRKIRSAKPNGRIVERSRSSGRSIDTKLLGQ